MIFSVHAHRDKMDGMESVFGLMFLLICTDKLIKLVLEVLQNAFLNTFPQYENRFSSYHVTQEAAQHIDRFIIQALFFDQAVSLFQIINIRNDF